MERQLEARCCKSNPLVNVAIGPPEVAEKGGGYIVSPLNLVTRKHVSDMRFILNTGNKAETTATGS